MVDVLLGVLADAKHVTQLDRSTGSSGRSGRPPAGQRRLTLHAAIAQHGRVVRRVVRPVHAVTAGAGDAVLLAATALVHLLRPASEAAAHSACAAAAKRRERAAGAAARKPRAGRSDAGRQRGGHGDEARAPCGVGRASDHAGCIPGHPARTHRHGRADAVHKFSRRTPSLHARRAGIAAVVIHEAGPASRKTCGNIHRVQGVLRRRPATTQSRKSPSMQADFYRSEASSERTGWRFGSLRRVLRSPARRGFAYTPSHDRASCCGRPSAVGLRCDALIEPRVSMLVDLQT